MKNASNPIKLAIVDDHKMLRESLITALSNRKDLIIEFEAANGKMLIEALSAASNMPDICLLDIAMPIMNGFETLLKLQAQWPDIKVIVITMFDSQYSLADMIKNGARAYLLKDAGVEELYRAILAVQEKGFYFQNLQADQMVEILHKKTVSPLDITTREKEFLTLCCTDLHYDDIARIMNISKHTINTYCDILFKKFKVRNRAGLIMCAWQTGIVQPPTISTIQAKFS